MSQSTSTTSSEEASNTSNNQAVESGDMGELPTTFEAALQRIEELKSKRDSLLAQKEKSAKEIEKLTKASRMATLKTLVPRELFARSDTYEAELEKVYSWKNIPDEDIAAIYAEKLRSIDLGKRVKQHGSSSMQRNDLYGGFRSVPNFHTAAAQKTTNSDNVKLFGFMKKIAGATNPDSNINNN